MPWRRRVLSSASIKLWAVTNPTAIASIRRFDGNQTRTDQDLVAVESPLAIELRHAASPERRQLGMFMRTPGDDRELVLGLLYAEGLVGALADVEDIALQPAAGERPDTAEVVLASTIDLASIEGRLLATSSACGLCGRMEFDHPDTLRRRVSATPLPPVRASVILSLPVTLRLRQAIFDHTGGLHAAGLFDDDGTLRAIREDIGRHNAVDKLVGVALEAGWLPAANLILAVSGRVAYEIVQKAVMAGVSTIVAVGAPSSLAVSAARAARATLIGFVRDGRFNVYTGAERVIE
jgi:FdhD protein